MLGKTEGKKKRAGQRMRRLGMSLSTLGETVKDRGAWHAAAHRVAKVGHDLALNSNNNTKCY